MQCVKGVRYMTLEDELNFFGMNTDFTGMTASELYSKMARTYSKGLVSSPLSWNKVSDTSIIEELKAEGKVKGEKSEGKDIHCTDCRDGDCTGDVCQEVVYRISWLSSHR